MERAILALLSPAAAWPLTGRIQGRWSKTIGCFAAALILSSPWLLPLPSTAAQTEAAKIAKTTQAVKNRDGSEFRLRSKVDELAQYRSVEVQFRRKAGHRWRDVGEFTQPWESPEDGRVFLIDWDKDGMHEIEVITECDAGPNCDGAIYRLERESRRLVQSINFSGASVSLIQGHLVELGRDSCCAWGARVYPYDAKRHSASSQPSFFVTVGYETVPDGKGKEFISCTFYVKTQTGRKVIAPPAKAFLRICQNYGKKYRLIRPA